MRAIANWTDESSEACFALWRAGETASAIAAKLFAAFGLKVSRNAVIGKIHRAGGERRAPRKRQTKLALPQAPRPGRRVRLARAQPKPPTEKASVRASQAQREADDAAARARADALAPAPLPDGRLGGLLDLTSRRCKWPIGDPREAGFAFCCRPIDPAAARPDPYCPAHAALARAGKGRLDLARLAGFADFVDRRGKGRAAPARATRLDGLA